MVRHLPLVLEVPGSNSACGEKKIDIRNAFSSVICRDDARKVRRPSDRDVYWMSPVQGKSPPVQVKEPYGNLDMVTCRLSSCNPVYKVHLPIILGFRQYFFMYPIIKKASEYDQKIPQSHSADQPTAYVNYVNPGAGQFVATWA